MIYLRATLEETSVTLVDHFNGVSWSLQSSSNPSGASTSELHGVSCPTASAAGYFFNGAGVGLTLAESWNGTSWSIKPTPNLTGAKRSTFNAVGCASAASCVAAGYTLDSAGVELTLAEAWNGTSWAIQPSPNPTGARNSLLASVACPLPTACITVGNYVSSSDVKMTLAEARRGTSWAVQPTPNPAGATGSVLRGLACTSATACTAVGSYVSAGVTRTLAERWNGTIWSIQTPINVTGATSNFLVSVSCTTATNCTAVGHYVNGAGASVPLAENWNGTSWAVKPAPVAAGAQGSLLTGVSCTAATACTAVGNSTGPSGASAPLAEAWNGTTWTIQTTPTPAGATAAALDGVSCPTATGCTASGYALASTSLPLAMRN